MNSKYYNAVLKTIFVVLGLLCIIMYALDIVYSNKMHGIFILMNPTYNSKLNHYNALLRIFSSIYMISVHALVFPILYLNAKNKIKGWLYLNIAQAVIFVCCYGLDMILGNYYFKPSGKVLEFGITLVSTSILYLVLCLFYIFRKKKDTTLQDLT